MKLLKATLPKLWRLTRATSMVVGLAVMVALVAGVVSLAVAKAPSGGTSSSALLLGIKNTASAMTTLFNSGTNEPALRLEVNDPANTPPLSTNSTAVVDNLHAESADNVGGKDPSQIFPNLYQNVEVHEPPDDGKSHPSWLGFASCDSGDPAISGGYVLDNRDFVTSAFVAFSTYNLDYSSIDGVTQAGRATVAVLCADVAEPAHTGPS